MVGNASQSAGASGGAWEVADPAFFARKMVTQSKESYVAVLAAIFAMLEPSRGVLGPSRSLLGPSRGVPGASQEGPMGSRGGPRGRLMGSRGAPEAVLGGLGGVILRKTKILQHKIAIRCDLEPSWARLGPVLGRLGPLLGPSWGHLGAILGPSWAILRPFLAVLGDPGGVEGEILEISKTTNNLRKT